MSHTLTHPSLDPVTISGAPNPTFSPPMPSIALMIELWPFTVKTGVFRFSRSHTERLPE